MTVTVRAVTAQDGLGRAALWLEGGRYFAAIDPAAAREPDAEGLVEWLDDIWARSTADPAMLMLVAERDGALVGSVVARRLEPVTSARFQMQRDLGVRRVHVDALLVAASARRSGVGTALLAAVEQWAAEHGAQVVTLETGLGNPTSVPFYEERMGYHRHEVVFRKALR
ncbi:GNAT family N-acetyltransferase [Dactylosporangium matsuzakiense]|nr:GNAT family N-acetyltransferase [Dactylosporangium matsuzakiense]UWZ41125.1 GNAT family N-acetyltransferase [Dactylosporangium matsuzakiense]